MPIEIANDIRMRFPALQHALLGQYAFESELGVGGMGTVFLARDVRLDRLVAIKVLPTTAEQDPVLHARFLTEARTAGKLSHPHIVPIFRADELGGHAFFAMSYIDRENLGTRIRREVRTSSLQIARYLREVAWALAYAHARGVVHRDIKPENIMIEHGSGRAIVTDFGIARTDGGSAIGDVVHTDEWHLSGTAYYMSPEQIHGDTIDGRSDLYALGVVGFLALSGRLPFEGTVPAGAGRARRPACAEAIVGRAVGSGAAC